MSGTWKGNPIAAVIPVAVLECIFIDWFFKYYCQIIQLFMLCIGHKFACFGYELTRSHLISVQFSITYLHTCLFGLSVPWLCLSSTLSMPASQYYIMLLLVMLYILFAGPPSAQWGSISQALMFHQVRRRNKVRKSLKHVGSSSVENCNPTDLEDSHSEENKQWLSFVDHMHVRLSPKLTIANSVREGVQHFNTGSTSLIQTDGFTSGECKISRPYDVMARKKHIDVTVIMWPVISDILRMKREFMFMSTFSIRLDKHFIAK
ncbi:Solute carrier family 12 member 9 [Lucilia cuprina]|nr:Solute carrier family 12 member 9 [Lucilia cuprina]